jgi:hypothetical protein
MTRIIYKYPVEPEGVIVQGHNQKVVLVGIDPKINAICIWVEHELPKDKLDVRTQYLIMGTGFGMEDDESFHAGSCITREGYVWHVYGKRLP